MAKPQINEINPFDANYDTTIYFSWSGQQLSSNRIVIYNNSTLVKVFDDTVDSSTNSHIIPNHTLINGETYIIQCQAFDIYGNSSDMSNKYYFKTFTTPRFVFDNITNGQTITESSCSVDVYYFQLESEPLLYYKFAIYDSHKILIGQTNDIYNTDNISYIYKGLSADTTYYIRCFGATKNGMIVDTGYIEIYVDYEERVQYSRLYVENDPKTGGITYRTNIIIVEPEGSETYEYEDEKINLVDKTIVYNTGFSIDDDFTLKLRGTYLYRNGDVIILKTENNDVTVSAYIYDDNRIKYKITVPNGISKYIIYSNAIQASQETLITLAIRRIGGLYDIKAYIN